MKRLLLLTMVLVFAAAGPSAAEWKNGGCEGPMATEIRHHTEEQTKEKLHQALRLEGNDVPLHDIYLSAPSLGDKETVPLLIERLRLELGSTEPRPQPGVQHGFICSQVHLVDALRSLTNTDEGMYYPRWAAWWQANAGFSQRRWAIDGFAADGLHAVDPVDERFALELMDVLAAPRHPYNRSSALLLLADAPAAIRMKWVSRAIESGKRNLLLGAIDVLRANAITGDEDSIRKLASDADLRVRREAAGILYERQRRSRISRSQAGLYCQAPPDPLSRFESVSFLGNVLVVGQTDRVTGFDSLTRRALWTQKEIPDEMSDLVLVVGDRVIFATRRGGLYALNARGSVLWRKDPVPSQGDGIQHLLRQDQDIVVLRQRIIEHIDADTGNTKSQASVGTDISSAGATRSAVYLVDQTGLHSPDGSLRFAGATGVAVGENALCVTSGKSPKECRITCLAADGATLRWSKPVEDEVIAPPVIERARVYVPARNSLTAFDAGDGSVLWATDEDVSEMIPAEYGLFLSGADFELRDPQTGEVRRTWPQIFGVSRIAVQGRYAAVIALDGVLWLIDLSDLSHVS